MSWPRLALRFRYTVFAVLIAVTLFGLVARLGLPVQLFPDTDPPVVTVMTVYPGVAAVDVAKNLSKRIEEELGGIDGVRRITSTNQTGLSVVKAEFHYGREVGDAALDVQNAIGRIRPELPQGVSEPQVLEFSSSDRPIVTVAVTSPSLSLPQVRELADNAIRDRLQLVDGVATVDVFGGNKNRLEVQVERDRLRAYGVDMDAIRAAIAGWNLTEPGGRIVRGSQEALVRFDAPLSGAKAVAQLVVARDGDRAVRVGDLARVELGPGEARSAYRFDGAPAIAVQVLKREEANAVAVAGRVRAELASLRQEHPELRLTVADDDSVFTELVIDNMTATVFTAIVLTIAVVLLFLANLRQAAIVALSIPVAFLLTFCLMYLAGIELNMVTMSAIILSIGLLVDDGIVVLENVHRHLQAGDAPPRAAVRGTEEIFLADLSGTLTTMAVLVPLTFLGGFVGRLFGPLAWTLIFALGSSFLVSVTLIPLLAALWLRPEEDGAGRLARALRPFTGVLDHLCGSYLALLGWTLRRPLLTLGIAGLILAVSVRAMALVGSEMLPRFDSGNFQVLVDTVPGAPLEQTVEAVSALERHLLKESEVVTVSTRIGYEPGGHYLGGRGAMDVNQAEITVNLTSRDRRDEDMWSIMARVRTFLEGLPGIAVAVVKEKGGTARSTTAASIDVRLSGPEPTVLDRLADELLDALANVPGVTDPYKSWGLDTPQLKVVLDRERVGELGVTGLAVARGVFLAVEGEEVAPFRQEHRRDLAIHLRYAEPDRTFPEHLDAVHVTGTGSRSAPLRDLARFELEPGPRTVTRENFVQTLDVLGNHYGRPLSETVADVQAVVAGLELPPGYQAAIGGEQTDFQEARGRMLKALAVGILAVYLVLVAQFRSFKHPLTIMAAVPLQFIGVALALLVAGKYLSMPALLGVILLTGTVVNNSIVLVDYVLARRGSGMTLEEALGESVSVRFRPIMMTALSDVAGMLPLALEMAVGAERFSPIATVVIGGILAATLLTLVVIPTLLMLVERHLPGKRSQTVERTT